MLPWSLESFTFSLVPITCNKFPRSLKFCVKVPSPVDISCSVIWIPKRYPLFPWNGRLHISLVPSNPGRPSMVLAKPAKCAVIEIFDDYVADLMANRRYTRYVKKCLQYDVNSKNRTNIYWKYTMTSLHSSYPTWQHPWSQVSVTQGSHRM